MPIIVLKANDSSFKKKVDLVVRENKGQAALLETIVDSDDDNPPHTSHDPPHSSRRSHGKQSVARNMDDVINLKVYRVSKPHFIDGTVKTTLVGGDVYYNQDEMSEEVQNNLHENKTLKEREQLQKPSLLQKFRAFRSQHPLRPKDMQDGFVPSIQADGNRCKYVMAGQILSNHVKGPNSEESLLWAINFVCTNEHTLTTAFLDLAHKLKAYEAHLLK
jgi:hypothetical protein